MFDNFYKNKRVLVTGHTGFKGSWLSTWLIELGAKVAGYSVDIPTNPANFEILDLERRIKHYQGDVRDTDKLKKVCAEYKPEIIFHLAAQALVGKSYINPVETISTNTIGTLNILDILCNCLDTKVAILITSDKCYQNNEWLWVIKKMTL